MDSNSMLLRRFDRRVRRLPFVVLTSGQQQSTSTSLLDGEQQQTNNNCSLLKYQ